MRIQLFLLSFICFLSISCAETNDVAELYIKTYAPIAIEEMKRSGIPASITLSQGIFESNYGRSSLSKRSNNHFGIKCGRNWTGKTTTHDDDRPNECFRVYPDVRASYKDHTDFLMEGERYNFLFDFKSTNYKNWAKGLKKAGYATNPKYPEKLITVIERYKLYQYDDPKYRGAEKKAIKTIAKGEVHRDNGIRYITAEEGQNAEDISSLYHVPEWQIYRSNEMTEDKAIVPGQQIYLERKKWRASKDAPEYYTVKEGETMWDIGQKYGVRLKPLYRRNRLVIGANLEPGQKIWLRHKSPQTN